ncbi:hypothetical protein T03_14544 [Trichinella britovi]|uniref:Uncharacterized protein n=1 Tax=Trichinella britovi TaxID=45882 RepID=A0A0V1DCW7_TRIBR|nr:hypothetical protein T03_14544 [Trichinella britovi]
MALTFDSLAEDGGRQRAMSLRLPGGDVNSFGGWFPSVSLNALRRLSSTARSEQLSSSLEKPRKRSRISLVMELHNCFLFRCWNFFHQLNSCVIEISADKAACLKTDFSSSSHSQQAACVG